jgi:hypothetical protein
MIGSMKEKEKERVFVFFPPKGREWDEKHESHGWDKK